MRFLFVDRIVQSIPGELVRGLKHVTKDDHYLYEDDQGQYCFAPSLIGESLGQLAAWNVMATNDFTLRPVAGVVASARTYRPVRVGETLLLESFIDCLDDRAVQYHSVARVGAETVFTVDGALGPLLPMSRFIDDGEVRRQYAEIDRPGDWSQIGQIASSHAGIICAEQTPFCVPMQFDRLLCCEPGISMTAEKRISRTAPYFPDHFPYNPVLPMTILLECKLHLARIFLKKAAFSMHYSISELRKIKMNEFVCPGDILHCHVSLLDRDETTLVLRYRSEVDGRRVCVLDVVMKAEGYQHE